MPKTITSRTGHDYDFFGFENGKAVYALVPSLGFPHSPSVKRIISIRVKAKV